MGVQIKSMISKVIVLVIAIAVTFRDINLTWTYKILYGEYHPGAPMGGLLILGSILVMVGIRKRKENSPGPLLSTDVGLSSGLNLGE